MAPNSRGMYCLACLGLLQYACTNVNTPCQYEVKVYDGRGVRLDYRVKELLPSRPWIERAVAGLLVGVSDKTTFRFPRNIDEFSVVLQGSFEQVQVEVPTRSCGGKLTTTVGLHRSTELTSAGLEGRLVGCSFGREWWVETSPQFGTSERPAGSEAFLTNDGQFVFPRPQFAENQIIVIGRNARVVKSVIVSASSIADGRVGDVDVTMGCKE